MVGVVWVFMPLRFGPDYYYYYCYTTIILLLPMCEHTTVTMLFTNEYTKL